ncbi:FKBP-type peptidyl-prolyl cis-trans isomerase SlyD [Alteromonadaceae bacterium Bs31]|nr:FKBP-type peptidyl-prolyl cis-trans isomerase SlyD [Alteromonadaceae bacterium Bs31]
MKIENNSVVSIHYTLTGEDGEVIDTSEGRDPLNFLAGASNIIPGLEQQLIGCSVGDKKDVVVQPEDGYGELQADLIQTLPKDMFTGIEKIEVGMEFQAQGPNGEVQFVVVKDVADDGITIDANHALAGKVLNFAVSVEAVREATQEEIDHGHVH